MMIMAFLSQIQEQMDSLGLVWEVVVNVGIDLGSRLMYALPLL